MRFGSEAQPYWLIKHAHFVSVGVYRFLHQIVRGVIHKICG